MATVKVNDLVNKAMIILQDTTSVRWPREELIGWLNDAYREIILARPDANSESGQFRCAAGTRQRLDKPTVDGGFPNALKLLDVVRNLAPTSQKKAIRVIERAILDDQRRGWHNEAQSVDVEHFMVDPRLPREFLVYPPATQDALVEVVFSSVPQSHSTTLSPNDQETIRIVDNYANTMLDYILYRAYSKDAEYAENGQRALNHYNAMITSLGVKTQADMAVSPRMRYDPVRGPRETELPSPMNRPN